MTDPHLCRWQPIRPAIHHHPHLHLFYPPQVPSLPFHHPSPFSLLEPLPSTMPAHNSHETTMDCLEEALSHLTQNISTMTAKSLEMAAKLDVILDWLSALQPTPSSPKSLAPPDAPMPNLPPMVGINSGTTYSCVKVWQHHHVEIIATDQRNRSSASYFAFTERLIGDAAKYYVTINPINTIFNAKRLCGRRFSAASIRSDRQLWLYKLPFIDVIGDQSSSKSSVLESLAAIKLPRGQGTCTRVPLDMRLRNHPFTTLELVLEFYGQTISIDEAHISQAISAATAATEELACHGKGISNNPLTLLEKKNGVPDLYPVDLPCIIQVPVHGQPKNIYDQIKDMIMEYIKPEASILLTVLSASVDFTTCESIGMSQSVEKTELRTLAVVTKTDKSPESLLKRHSGCLGIEGVFVILEQRQKDIYYITGESKEVVATSPFLERLKKNDYEVLFMVDAIDEYAVRQPKEYDGKKLASATKQGLKLDDETGRRKRRIVDTPCYWVNGEYGRSANMERIMKAQALRNSSMSGHLSSKKTMEINPDDGIMKELRKGAEADKNGKTVKDHVLLLFESALLTSGFSLDDPNTFALRIHKIWKLGLSIDKDDNDDI
ncbi:Heat shock protein 82 [Glycine max]|nr:Heat shock protein 82 [Glycine max]